MRYRLAEDGVVSAVQSSAYIVTATVWFTLAIGIGFVVVGIRGKQTWLQFWGVLTCLCCAVYFMRSWLGLPGT